MSGIERRMAGKVEIKKLPTYENKAGAFFEELKDFLRKSRAKDAAKLLKTLNKVEIHQIKETPERLAFVGHLKKRS